MSEGRKIALEDDREKEGKEKKMLFKGTKKGIFSHRDPCTVRAWSQMLTLWPILYNFNISPFIDTKYTVIQWSIKFNGLFIGTAGSLKPLALKILSKIYISGKLIPVLERIILG